MWNIAARAFINNTNKENYQGKLNRVLNKFLLTESKVNVLLYKVEAQLARLNVALLHLHVFGAVFDR